MGVDPLNIAIVGCGIGGLSAAIGMAKVGHKVMIFERTSKITQIGAGIQLAPNTTRILQEWGLLPQVLSHSVEPKYLKLKTYRDGSILSQTQIDPQMKTAYGVPYLVIHRADLHQAMLTEAETLDIPIRLGSDIEIIDPLGPSVVLSGGKKFKCDVVFGADGIHSVCRKAMTGHPQSPFFPGDVAFRVVLPRSELLTSLELADILQAPAVHCWMGPSAHVVLYPLQQAELYNVVFLLSDENIPDLQVDDKPKSLNESGLQWLKDRFAGWCREIHALLSITKGAGQWKLEHCQEAVQWVHSSGNMALLGDACHATLPYLAQGAALALEDGAFLGTLFKHIKTKDDIKTALQLYEETRKPRATEIVKRSEMNRGFFNMPDGEGQKTRDERMKVGDSAFIIFQEWLYGYNAFEEAEKAWQNLMSENTRT